MMTDEEYRIIGRSLNDVGCCLLPWSRRI